MNSNIIFLINCRLVEKNTDAFLESNEKGKKKQEEVEETVNNRKFNFILFIF